MKKILFFIASALMLGASFAKASDKADFTDLIYAGDTVAMAGTVAEIPIYITNPSALVRGLQFNITLPTGFSFVASTDPDDENFQFSTTSRIGSGFTVTFKNESSKPGNIALLTCAHYQSNSATLSGNSGAVMTIKVNVDASLAVGSEHTVTISNIELSDPSAVVFPGLTDASFDATITIVDDIPVDYDEGYSLFVTDFRAESNTAYDADAETGNHILTVQMFNPVVIASVDFDIEFPEGFGIGLADGEPDVQFTDDYYTRRAFPEATDNGNGSYHVSAAPRSAFAINAGEVLLIPITTSALAKGVYEINVRNIVMTDEDEHTYNAAPFVIKAYVGSYPTALEDNTSVAAEKAFRDGQILILCGGHVFDATGRLLK